MTVANHERAALRLQATAGVPQTSQSAVSRVSQPADGSGTGRARLLDKLPIGQSAIRQVGKPAVRTSQRRVRAASCRPAPRPPRWPTPRKTRHPGWKGGPVRRAGRPALRQARCLPLRPTASDPIGGGTVCPHPATRSRLAGVGGWAQSWASGWKPSGDEPPPPRPFSLRSLPSLRLNPPRPWPLALGVSRFPLSAFRFCLRSS